MVSPYGGPVTAGKPGIHVVPSRFGFSQSPLPALCRQATSCAWRCRPRKITDRRSGCSRGRAEVSSGGNPERRWDPKRPPTGTETATTGHRSRALGRPWRFKWPSCCPRSAPESTGDTRQTLRTLWPRGQMSPKLYESLHIWNTASISENVSRNGARHTLRTVWFRGHGRRSARHVVTSPLRFCSFAKTTSSSAGRKTARNHWKYVTK